MRLYLMRHAEADQAELDDAKRPLTARGEHDAQHLANFLQARGYHLSHVIHSGKLRAQQTAEIIVSALASGQSAEIESALTGDDGLSCMLEKIATWTEDTLVVSHLPFISRLLSRLVAENADVQLVGFVPATVVCLELCESAKWRMKWCINPSLAVPPSN